jgi:hypothetical protein
MRGHLDSARRILILYDVDGDGYVIDEEIKIFEVTEKQII